MIRQIVVCSMKIAILAIASGAPHQTLMGKLTALPHIHPCQGPTQEVSILKHYVKVVFINESGAPPLEIQPACFCWQEEHFDYVFKNCVFSLGYSFLFYILNAHIHEPFHEVRIFLVYIQALKSVDTWLVLFILLDLVHRLMQDLKAKVTLRSDYLQVRKCSIIFP